MFIKATHPPRNRSKTDLIPIKRLLFRRSVAPPCSLFQMFYPVLNHYFRLDYCLYACTFGWQNPYVLLLIKTIIMSNSNCWVGVQISIRKRRRRCRDAYKLVSETSASTVHLYQITHAYFDMDTWKDDFLRHDRRIHEDIKMTWGHLLILTWLSVYFIFSFFFLYH